MRRRLATAIVLTLAAATLVAQDPLPSSLGPARLSRAAPPHELVKKFSPVADRSLLERFLSYEVEPLVRYRATRRLEAENGRFNVKGWMEVVTELSPEKGFTWTVIDEGGSGYIRGKVLRKTLEGEAKAVRNNDPSKAALDESNYTFAVAGASEPQEPALASTEDLPENGLARLIITPKRKDMMRVNGALILAEADADLVAVKGRLAKTPSFWTRSVDIVRRYARIGGIRVPVVTESTANVRIAGRSEFRMTYTYQMINGREVAAEAPAR